MPETAPYPALPPSFLESAVPALPFRGVLRLRRFGTQLEDLRVDLTGNDRPHAITNILECCTVPGVGRDFSWDLPIGKRIECLLVLAALDGAEQVDADLRCPSCRQMLEVTLTVEELLEGGRAAADATIEVEVDGTTRRFRRPTGRDQLAWMKQAYPDEESVRLEMVASLAVTDGAVSGAELAPVEAALDRADPLLRSAVLAECPDCGQSAEHEIDLAGFALGRLRRSQDMLFETVHLLASRYHWSEADILNIPEWRRARYVAMLDGRG